MSDAAPSQTTAASPSNRARLVVASQGLEIQHLQEQLARKEREAHATVSRVLGEKAQVEAQLATQQARCARFESQLQLLGERLKELEAAEGNVYANDMSAMSDVSKSAKERDETIAAMREELRTLRVQNSSLLQERDVVLERVADEQRRREAAERELQARRQTHSSPQRSGHTVDAGTQPADAAAYATVEDVLAAIAVDQPNADAEIAALRAAQHLEVQLDAYHRAVATQHAANAAVIEQALQRKVEAEVARLSAEQEKYRSMLGANAGGAGASSSFAGYHHHQQQQQHHTPSFGRAPGGGGLPSPVPPASSHHPSPAPSRNQPDVSPSTVFSGNSALRQPPPAPPMTSFVSQQQEELAALRTRLMDLQARHDEVRGVRPGHAVHVSPPAPLGARHAYASSYAADTAHRRSPSPEAHSAAPYAHGVPQPTPGPAARSASAADKAGLTRSAASSAAQPSSVLDRMLQKARR